MPTPRWYQHPVTVFLVPLIAFLCLPQIYRFLPFNTDPSYDVGKLHEIASWMDAIYVILANSTFIPHNAITRGPHKINTTAIPCKPDRSVLRLIEILPYVDISLVQEPDWIYGGWFMDYRNPEHLAELCDPLRGESIDWTDYMAPSDVALTNWGTGGWNNDRTFVMIYNTEKDSIRIFDAELWVEPPVAKHEFGNEMNDWWFEDGEPIWDRNDGAPHVLRAVTNNYRQLKWTPWATSNREDGFGAPNEVIKTVLDRNGWPDTFESDQFNADFIRAKHKPSGKGYAQKAFKRIEELAGFNHTMVEHGVTWYDSDKGQIRWQEERALRDRKTYEETVDIEERELRQYRYQSAVWVIEDLRTELEAANSEVERLCPDGVCTKEEDMILWEYSAMQRTYEEASYSNDLEHCEHLLHNTPPYDPAWLDKCTENRATWRVWLDLAFEQSHSEAVAHCERSGCELLPFKDVFDRARDKIADYQQRVARRLADIERVEAEYKGRLPELGAKARKQIEADMDPERSSVWYLETQIQAIKEEMARLNKGASAERGQKVLFEHLREDD